MASFPPAFQPHWHIIFVFPPFELHALPTLFVAIWLFLQHRMSRTVHGVHHYAVSSHFGPKTLFSNTRNLCSSARVVLQLLHPLSNTGRIPVLYTISTFSILIARLKVSRVNRNMGLFISSVTSFFLAPKYLNLFTVYLICIPYSTRTQERTNW